MAELIDIANALFTNKEDWKKITESDKEKFFFIFNRYFSKKYPDKAQLLNHKNIDKVTSFDLWFYFMIDKPYPKWFWSKGEKEQKREISESDYKSLLYHLKVKDLDLDYLVQQHPEFIAEELKYLKDLKKNK